MEHNLGHFPLELVESILAHMYSRRDLFHCTLINKRFYTAAIPKLWHTPGSTHRYGANHVDLGRVLASLDHSRQPAQPHLNNVPLAHHIRRLRFPQNDSIQDILKLLEQAPLVEDIRLSRQTLSDEDMIQLAHFCPRLKNLSLNSIAITDTAMITVAHSCPMLRNLELHNCNRLTPTTLIALKNCLLEFIELDDCDLLDTDATIQPLLEFHTLKELLLLTFSSKVVNGLIRQAATTKVWPKLETFLLDECGLRGSPLDDYFMSLFIQSHSTLESVTLNESFIGDLTVLAIANSLPRLWRLVLNGNRGISAHAIRQVVKNCTRLNHILLMSCHFSTMDFPETGEGDQDEPLNVLREDTIQRIRLGWALRQGRKALEDDLLR